MPAALLEIKYRHVHDCQADREGRPCMFEWSTHAESQLCACGPQVDETNLMLDGQVFVVHRGVC